MHGRARRLAEVGYPMVVAGLAVAGAVEQKAVFYLVAIALTLPAGIAAVVVIYGGYPLIAAVGGIWTPATRPDGSDAAWLTTASATLNVVALVLAAIVDVVLLERALRRRSARAGAAALPHEGAGDRST
ncbi:hypothetical protein POF50_026350 [Streptomyces sp. SL13]|uniref:Uncharacterized protein n=1 Tax=Streptantibioticus silvisoli TaxID=2705255 RepID=A0AA90KB42_9ACTN|nr:hypothetical protein [Streptantibioticus silvisoli]MDI5963795.1 hypothetical protein [Streptantibioticus silvisoli]MDI5972822.1 hypothetical protein [Streptantibioticus silvisoli]